MHFPLIVFSFLSLLFLTDSSSAQQLPGFTDRMIAPIVCEDAHFIHQGNASTKLLEICRRVGYSQEIRLAECSNVDQCGAALVNDTATLFCEPSFIAKFNSLPDLQLPENTLTQAEWNMLALIGHEIGHHALHHVKLAIEQTNPIPLVDFEWAADRYAGMFLAKLGASTEQLQAVLQQPQISAMSNIRHAARQERLEAFQLGYKRITAKSTDSGEMQSALQIADAIDFWINGEISKAITLLLANPQHPRTWYYLGLAYRDGKGVPKDIGKAMFYFQKAADQGHAYAQYQWANIYRKGLGVKRDLRKAFESMQLSARQNYPQALLALSDMYLQGEGCEQSNLQFIETITQASRQDIPDAHYLLGCLYRDGKLVERNPNRAFEYFKRAAIFGHQEAQFTVALFYEEGVGTEKNLRYAIHWYKKAARQHSEPAKQACRRLQVEF